MDTDAIVISRTIAWIKSVVIDCHFCPFAAKAMLTKSIRYVVVPEADIENSLHTLLLELKCMDDNDQVETTFIILPDRFNDFIQYLGLVGMAESMIKSKGYEGIYQIASFHPEYLFSGADNDDPANYTNRSVYPMLHILREESISRAVDHYGSTDSIPKDNIEFARQKGLQYMQALRASCMDKLS